MRLARLKKKGVDGLGHLLVITDGPMHVQHVRVARDPTNYGLTSSEKTLKRTYSFNLEA